MKGWIIAQKSRNCQSNCVFLADEYRPYDTIAAEAVIIRLCCWVHARREFIIPAEQGDPIARSMLDRIHDLYQIERDTRHSDEATRLQRRQRDARPLLDGIRTACIDALPRYDGGSTMHKALSYLLIATM